MERRRHPRIAIEDHVFIAISNGHHRIGRVRDISLGGLAFEHIYEGDLNWIEKRKDVLLWVNDRRLSRVPCTIVYDTPLPIGPEYGMLTIQLTTRRCGVRFEPLTEEQAEQLISFLKLFTEK